MKRNKRKRPPVYLTEWDRRHARRNAWAKLTSSTLAASLGAGGVFAGVLMNLHPLPVLAASLWTFTACGFAGWQLAKFHRARP